MLEIAGYDSIVPYKVTPSSRIYRARRSADGMPVIIKALASDEPAQHEIAMLRREYSLLQRAKNPHLVQCFELVQFKYWAALILEDFHARSLLECLALPLPLPMFFRIASGAIDAIAALHAHGIVHKDINSGNLLANNELTIKLVDLGIASELATESLNLAPYSALEGTLAYMAPEQTGRLNRPVDFRSDYYSLGITLFELLTGELPFRADDTIGFIHAHIAMPLPPLQNYRDDIPRGLQEILEKMTAKDPEGRYQSAEGLKDDLEKCAAGVAFNPGASDHSDRFILPTALYGREGCLTRLKGAVQRIKNKGLEIINIKGPSGIGKSAVVDELGQTVVENRAYFVKIKFDILQEQKPYQTISSIIDSLYKQAMVFYGNEPQLFKEKVRNAANGNWSFVKRLAPSLHAYCGAEAVDENFDAGNELRNRMTLRALLQIFTSARHPLVLCFDDVQWADIESLNFLRDILRQKAKYLLIILSMRDEEIKASSAINDYLSNFATLAVYHLEHLQPLGLTDLTALLAATMRVKAAELHGFAEDILAKTGGNPLYVKELLYALYRENIIRYDAAQRVFVFDPEQLRHLNVAGSIADFMIKRLNTLEEQALLALKVAAAIGHEFSFRLLKDAGDFASEELKSSLWQALKSGLITPLNLDYRWLKIQDTDVEDLSHQGRFRFHHDRIHASCYDMLDALQKPKMHLKIARALCQGGGTAEDITHHYKLAGNLLVDANECRHAAGLSHEMAIKARIANAYLQQMDYASFGLKLLNHVEADQRVNIEGDLLREKMHAAFFLDRIELGESIANKLLERAKDLTAKAELCYALGSYYSRLGLFDKNIEIGRQGLSYLGIKVRAKTFLFAAIAHALMVELLWRVFGIKGLLRAKQDPATTLAMKLFNQLSVPVAFMGNSLTAALIAYKAILLAFRRGSPPEGAVALINFAVVRLVVMRDQKGSKILLKAADKLLESCHDGYTLCQARFVIGTAIHANLHALSDIESVWEQSIKEAYSNGAVIDLLATRLQKAMHTGRNSLDLATVEAMHNVQIADENNIAWNGLSSAHFASHCQYLADPQSSLKAAMLEQGKELVAAPMLELVGRIFEVERLFIMRDFVGLLPHLKFTEARMLQLFGAYPFFHMQTMYSVLARVELLRQKQGNSAAHKLAIHIKMNLMRYLARNNSDLEHVLSILEAEFTSLSAPIQVVLPLYYRALGKNAHHHLKHEAITAELAGRYALRQGLKGEAKVLLQRALDAYRNWGAERKALEFAREHLAVLDSDLAPQFAATGRSTLGRSSSISKHSTAADKADLNSMHKIAHELTRNIPIDRLATHLVRHIMESAGANRGYLIVHGAREGDLQIAAGGLTLSINASTRSVAKEDILHAAVHFVDQSLEPLIVDELGLDQRFSSTPYAQQHKSHSLLLVPLSHQGKSLGQIYLENTLMTRAFGEDRVAIVQSLANQAALSLENAKLYLNQEESIRERTRQVRSLLKHVQQGIFTIDSDLRVEGDYSQHLKVLLKKTEIKGVGIKELLIDHLQLSEMEQSAILMALRSIVDSPSFAYEFNNHLLPREVRYRRGQELVLCAVEWVPIVNAEQVVEKVLVTMRDITELRAWERAAAEKDKELQYVTQVYSLPPGKFAAWLPQARALHQEVRAALASSSPSQAFHDAFLRLHTLKSMARSLAFANLSSRVHAAESTLLEWQRDGFGQAHEHLRREIDEIDEEIERYARFGAALLKQERAVPSLRDLGLNDETLSQLLTSTNATAEAVALRRLLTTTYCTSLKSLLAKATYRANTEHTLEKSLLIEALGEEVWLTPKGQSLIEKILPHVISNALAHSIEDRLTRKGQGKSPHGVLYCQARILAERKLQLCFYDDGAGLDPKRLVARGLMEAGATTRQTEVPLVEMLIQPGFSTAARTSEDSGRGMGLSAIAGHVKEHSGQLQLVLKPRAGGHAQLQLVVTLEQTTWTRADTPLTYQPAA